MCPWAELDTKQNVDEMWEYWRAQMATNESQAHV